ncbi:MAG: tetratricopeptide repeat protein, partial [Armatimonadota bacterium]
MFAQGERPADEALQKALNLLKRGRARKAAKALEALATDQPGDLAVRFWLGRSYVAARDYDRAVAQFHAVLRRKPESRESWVWLARALKAQGDEQGAKEAQAKAAALAPPAGQAHPEAPTAQPAKPQTAKGRPGKVDRRKPRSRKAEPKKAEPKRVEPAPAAVAVLEQPEHLLQSVELPKVGFDRSNVKVSVDGIGLRTDRAYDYTFTGAPTDWYVRGGTWEQMFRWTCTPTWTWFGGHSPDLAAVWNKRQFEGDISVEVWAAMRMGYNPRVPGFTSYINPNDINITICGDGANLDSGYSFIFGGWLNRYTRIMRGTEVLAETSDDAFVLPRFEDGWPGNFHRRWYNLKAVKRGSRLYFYFDNQLALQCKDPNPLPGGRVALWTYGNGIVVARVRINYEIERLDRKPIVLPSVPAPEPPPGPRVVFASDTHPSIQTDFESGIGQWKTRDGNSGAALSVVEAGAGRSGRCLQLTNVNSGGTFGATAVAKELDLSRYGQIRFDYRCTPDVKVNLYAVVNGQLYEIVFTAPDARAIDAVRIGAIEGVETNGKWHEAWLDLRAHLSGRYPADATLTLSEMFFANLGYNDYQQAGFGANPAGTTWYIDDFFVGSAGGRDATVTWQPEEGSGEVAGYAVAMNDKRDFVPKGRATQEASLELSGLKDGVYYVHVRPQAADGTWGPTAHYRVVADALPPRLDKNGTGGCELTPDGRLVVHLTDGRGAGIDPSTLVLTVQGREYTVASPAMKFDAVQETLTLDLATAGVRPADDHTLEAHLAPVSDRLGTAMSGGCNWTFRASGNGRQPPPAPAVTCATPYLIDEDFEDAPVTWAAWKDSQVTIGRDDSTAASGRYSLRIANQLDRGTFAVVPVGQPFNAGRYRLVSFDYKANDRIRVDFIIRHGGAMRAVGFLDTATSLSRIGKVPDVVADEQWHHAEFDLYEILRTSNPTAADYEVTTFAIGDYQVGSSSDSSNPRGATYHIDNFRIIPVVSARDGATFKWSLFDLTGITG